VDELAGIGVVQGGAAGLLALVVLLVLTGRLIPRRTYEDLREERDMWRTAFQASEDARHVEREQAVTAVEVGQTAVKVLQSLPAPSAEGVGHASVDQGVAQAQ
jgi:hypothetical protein